MRGCHGSGLDPHAEGRLVSPLLTPAGFEPSAVRDDVMWGVFTDEFDAESVRAYRLERDGG